MNEKQAKRLRREVKSKKYDLPIPWTQYGLAVYVPGKGLMVYNRKPGDELWLRGLQIIHTGLRSVYNQRKDEYVSKQSSY